MTEQQMRAEFEKWASENSFDTEKWGETYCAIRTRCAWFAWKASRETLMIKLQALSETLMTELQTTEEQYFSYTPTVKDFEFWDTAEEAKKAAEDAISKYCSSGYWDEHVNEVCWGRILEQATQCDRIEMSETKDDWFAGEDWAKPIGCSYELAPLK